MSPLPGQEQVVSQRFPNDEDTINAFMQQTERNSALREMASNPLMLNLLIAVFQEQTGQGTEDLNRAKVFDITVTSMLSHLEGVKRGKPETQQRATSLRRLLRNVAWEIHSGAGRPVLKEVEVELKVPMDAVDEFMQKCFPDEEAMESMALQGVDERAVKAGLESGAKWIKFMGQPVSSMEDVQNISPDIDDEPESFEFTFTQVRTSPS